MYIISPSDEYRHFTPDDQELHRLYNEERDARCVEEWEEDKAQAMAPVHDRPCAELDNEQFPFDYPLPF